jgi:hypothetical protein
MAAAVRLSREAAEWRDRSRVYKIVLDDTEVGTIGDGETAELQVSSGDHELYLRLDWVRSRTVSFSAAPGDVVSFVCRALPMSAFVLFQVVKSIFVREGWIELERVD